MSTVLQKERVVVLIGIRVLGSVRHSNETDVYYDRGSVVNTSYWTVASIDDETPLPRRAPFEPLANHKTQHLCHYRNHLAATTHMAAAYVLL